MTTPAEILDWASRCMGYAYIFGGELTGSSPGNCDCSELVEYAGRNAGAPITDGSWLQFNACDDAGLRVSFEQARNTPGALIFKSRTDAYPPPDGRDGIFHVALVVGPNETVEACCSDWDTLQHMNIDGRDWYPWGGLIPGVAYPGVEDPEPWDDNPCHHRTLYWTNEPSNDVWGMRKGEDVKWVQNKVGASPVDGEYGRGSVEKVTAWQSGNGVDADGQVGPLTASAMKMPGSDAVPCEPTEPPVEPPTEPPVEPPVSELTAQQVWQDHSWAYKDDVDPVSAEDHITALRLQLDEIEDATGGGDIPWYEEIPAWVVVLVFIVVLGVAALAYVVGGI